MTIIRHLFIWVFTFTVLFGSDAFAAKYYPPKTPWHFADIWWTAINETNDFKELSIEFEIIGKLSVNTLLYIAPMGLGKLNGVSFYGGIQTNAGGWRTKKIRTITKFGKGGIFSRWSKDGKPINLDYAQGDRNTHYESAGYEGNFVSVRNKFDWDEGTYKYSVRKLLTKKENGQTFTWFAAYVYDYKKDKEHYIGSLKFKGVRFTYGKSHAAFVEVYGGKIKSEIPQITVIFSEPKINGKKRSLKSTKVYYPNNNYKSNKIPRFAYSQVGKNKVVIITIPAGLNNSNRN